MAKSMGAQILLREIAHSTKGKGLKSLESRVVRTDVTAATTLKVRWSYPISGGFAGLKVVIDTVSFAATAQNVTGNPDVIYTFAGADLVNGQVITLDYTQSAGDIANAESGNPVIDTIFPVKG